MIINLNNKIFEKVLLLLVLLVMPISVMAPLGTWVPLILSSIIILLSNPLFFYKRKVDKIFVVL